MVRNRHRAPLHSTTELRIAKVLGDLVREKHTYVALARAISEANDVAEGEKDVVDRRKLKRIVEGDPNLVLSITELRALDLFLEPLGEGLAYNNFFLRANVLQRIADADRPVTFLLGSKPVDGTRLNLDHWDVKALAEIQRGVGRFSGGVRFDIRDMLLHEKLKDARRALGSTKWTKLLAPDGPSLVCLGSSRATHAAELLLSKMFGVAPFESSPEAKSALPFHFVWPPDLDHVFPSAFHYGPEQLSSHIPEAARRLQEGDASALEIDGTLYLDGVKQRRAQESFGVCVAQRRPSGQIWLVLAGVTGPATYGAARLATDLALQLHPAAPGRPSPVFWAPVRTLVKIDRTRSFGTFLTVEDQKLLSGPHTWTPA